MKKWLDDLYVILLKRGFKTLDDVLKKYKTEIEDYETVKINNDSIILNQNESITFNISDITSHLNIFDRFILINVPLESTWNFVWFGCKITNNACYKYSSYSLGGTSIINISLSNDNSQITFTNTSNQNLKFELYVKKFC